MVIVIGGMIGLGKTTVAEMLSEKLGSQVFYESVDDNPILPLFYTASQEEIEAKRYPFLLQLYFLNSRFKTIKDALRHPNNIIDRSIYEDWYFAKRNRDLGRISDLEFQMYENLLNNMLEELGDLPKKAPDLMIYLKGSFETVLKRIQLRGRSYELDESLITYYKFLWESYDDWVMHHYRASKVVTIDMDQYDVRNEADRVQVLKLITDALHS